MTRDDPRVLVRIITAPHVQRGERIVVFAESRTVGSPDVLVYSLTHDAWRVERHRTLMWQSKRADPHQQAEAIEILTDRGLGPVKVQRNAPHARDDRSDEPPADPDDR
jgi:hypothetical protein